MPNREQLQSLLGRVEKAGGPDSLLDTEIAIALGHAPRSDYWTATAVTASVDAALALVERALPGWQWWVSNIGRGDYVQAQVERAKTGAGRTIADAPTAPLAILAALLSALISALISESKPKQETQSTEKGT